MEVSAQTASEWSGKRDPHKLQLMSRLLLTLLSGRNLPKIQQPREPAPSIINEKTIADSMRVVKHREF